MNSSLNSFGVVAGCDRNATILGILAPALQVSDFWTIVDPGADCLLWIYECSRAFRSQLLLKNHARYIDSMGFEL